MTVDPALLLAWLTARSVARGLPAPVAEHGGFRVDTNSAEEIVRWVFPRMTEGLVVLGRSIDTPRRLLKLCGEPAELRAALPARWRLEPPTHFMIAGDWPAPRPLPPGYAVETDRDGAAVAVRIIGPDGDPAASGHAAQAGGAFAYDRIATAPAHRRKGLGAAVMAALRQAREDPHAPELLVATEDGRGLYASLGWRNLSPYATAGVAV